MSQKGNRIAVYILTKNDRSKAIEIGNTSTGVLFSEDPVNIDGQTNDTFDVLLRANATITLLTSNYLEDLFCPSALDAVVNIYKDNECVFAGFIEPQSYSQDYNELYDELEINCIDALTALQYAKYKNADSATSDYNLIKQNAFQKSYKEIMSALFSDYAGKLDIVGGNTLLYLFDGSKAIDSLPENKYSIFDNISISELLFLGDKESDVWQQDEVLEEMLKYLNLHIIQVGFIFYIFSWETIKSNQAISWKSLSDNYTSSTPARDPISIDLSVVEDTDTKISIGDTYNQLQLICKTESVESVIESPLDNDLLKSPFSNKQKYMTEYSSDGGGETAYNAFYSMIKGESTNYDGGKITEWFIQVMNNASWKFAKKGSTDDLINYYSKDKRNQQNLPNALATMPGAAIIATGKVTTETVHNNNAPTSKVDMSNCLFVSINGNGNDSENEAYPNSESIRKSIPLAIYTGNKTGGVFSPADAETTNYIVLSGKIALNPIMLVTDSYTTLHDNNNWGNLAKMPSRTNDEGRYYTRQYWKAEKPSDTAAWDNITTKGLAPYLDDGVQSYQYEYSAEGDLSDMISKVPVLACMLVIGDKCVVETGKSGNPSDFVWKTYKPLEQCASEDEYYQQSFTIGFDPKIGDYLLGTEFDFQNNISYTLGIDAEGIAIPITKKDKVSGVVSFKILGPVNALWNKITRIHPTFFRHTSWTTDSVPLLAHMANIMLKQFEVKVYSDNGLINNTEDNDLIYLSDTVEKFVNKKDDLEMKINSALTSAECQQLGITNSIKLSTPTNTLTDEAVLSIYDYATDTQEKAEKLYVNSYYKEYHAPRIIIEQSITDNSRMHPFFHYTHPALGKEFFVQSISRNLIEGTARLTMKEVEHD